MALAPPPILVSQAVNVRSLTTCAVPRISEWPAPHSSAHTMSWSPTLVGVARQFVVIPGTASDFSRKSGIQKEWITSLVRISNFTGLFTGR